VKKNGKPALHKVELVPIASLKPHSRNYRSHPDDQLEHLVESLRRFGVYCNVVVAKDGTILAGHGVVEAAKKAKMKEIPVIRLSVAPESSAAIKVLVGDNEIEHLAEQNDRLLSELLKELKTSDKLLGTGFDEKMLANFVMVTRPENEIADFDAAAAWVGMPEYSGGEIPLQIVVAFRGIRERAQFARKLGVKLFPKTKSIWYPPLKRGELASETKHAKFKA